MRRMPISVRCYPFLPRGCPRGMYAGLARLSAGYPPDRGRLHTCYSPVRRSPAVGASSYPAAARLACVKPAASVHPEPGSNSPLLVCKVLYLLVQVSPTLTRFLIKDSCSASRTVFCLSGPSLSLYGRSRNRRKGFVFNLFLHRSFLLSCGIFVNVLFASEPPGVSPCFLVCGCKVTTVFARHQILFALFSDFFLITPLFY